MDNAALTTPDGVYVKQSGPADSRQQQDPQDREFNRLVMLARSIGALGDMILKPRRDSRQQTASARETETYRQIDPLQTYRTTALPGATGVVFEVPIKDESGEVREGFAIKPAPPVVAVSPFPDMAVSTFVPERVLLEQEEESSKTGQQPQRAGAAGKPQQSQPAAPGSLPSAQQGQRAEAQWQPAARGGQPEDKIDTLIQMMEALPDRIKFVLENSG